LRFSQGTLPQVSSPGSPGFAIVHVRHSSLPVRASFATITQPSGPRSGAHARPEMTLPFAMIGPLDVLAGPVILTSHACLPVRASTAYTEPSPDVEIRSCS
jgi:hypothetical protein